MTAISSPLAIEVLFVEYGNTETIEPADLKPYVEAGGRGVGGVKGFQLGEGAGPADDRKHHGDADGAAEDTADGGVRLLHPLHTFSSHHAVICLAFPCLFLGPCPPLSLSFSLSPLHP